MYSKQKFANTWLELNQVFYKHNKLKFQSTLAFLLKKAFFDIETFYIILRNTVANLSNSNYRAFD